jgi:RNA polymerase sigma factor (TIGR02999 family)
VSPEDQQEFHDAIFKAAYEELRARARRLTRRFDVATLNTTALVHEAYMSLRKNPNLRVESEQHLKNLVAQAMYFIMVDAIRSRTLRSKDGALVPIRHVPLDHAESAAAKAEDPHRVMALIQALDLMSRDYPNQATAFKLRCFNGMPVVEIASMMECDERTVRRYLKFAKATLTRVLTAGPNGS